MSGLTPEQAAYAERGHYLVLSLVVWFARQWRNISQEELISVGNEEVVKAARTFNHHTGPKFETYARPAILGALIRYATREHYVVGAAQRELVRSSTAFPWQEEVQDLNEFLAKDPVPEAEAHSTLVNEVRGRSAEIFASTFGAFSARLTGGEDAMIEALHREQLTQRLGTAVAKLDEQERRFLQLHYDEELTMDAIAKELGVSRRTAFRVHDRIREKLAAELALVDEGPATLKRR